MSNDGCDIQPIERLSMHAAELMRAYPPHIRHRNKLAVFEIALPPGTEPGGRIEYSRWPPVRLPETVPVRRALDITVAKPGFYDYQPHLSPPGMEWHVNFADPDLFVAYGSGLFAQDEMMCAEHPVLGSVREAVLEKFASALTEEDGQPTPVLVAGAERRCRIDTSPDLAAGRPEGLYGRRFAAADLETVRRATVPIVPPTITNVLAIAAPSYGHGRYTPEEIQQILLTAFTGFLVARLESERLAGETVPVAVHTGFWGCGAFGGNRLLMTILQILAAGMAGLDALVYFTADAAGGNDFQTAVQLLQERVALEDAVPLAEVMKAVEGLGLRWGSSDGN